MAADISPIEQYVINKVKEMRKARKISQRQLTYELDVVSSFIGKVENPNERAKYNINHLNSIAKVFKCSIKDFFPDEPI